MSRDKRVAASPAPGCPRVVTLACVLVALLAAATLAGCGKKGAPLPPAGEPVTYPRAYPKS